MVTRAVQCNQRILTPSNVKGAILRMSERINEKAEISEPEKLGEIRSVSHY